jgi:hypothetical protein
MKRKLAGAMTTLLVAGLAAGCGGGDQGDAGRPALTKAAFITRADAICKATTDSIDAAGAKLRSAGAKTGTIPIAQVVTFLKNSSLPAYDRMVVDLRKLAPPKDDRQAIGGFVASLAGAVEAAKANPDKYARRTTADPFDDANKRARAYGMKVCGS